MDWSSFWLGVIATVGLEGGTLLAIWFWGVFLGGFSGWLG